MYIIRGYIILAVFASIILYSFVFGPVQQCGLCEPSVQQSTFSWIRFTISLIVIGAGVIALFMTPFFGGLKERDRIVLKWIFLKEKEKIRIYSLAKILRQREEKLAHIHDKQVYRIVKKLANFGIVNLDSNGVPHITSWGMEFIEKIK